MAQATITQVLFMEVLVLYDQLGIAK